MGILRELNEQQAALLDILCFTDEEDPERAGLECSLAAIGYRKEGLIDYLSSILIELDNGIDNDKATIKRLNDRVKARQRGYDRLKELIEREMSMLVNGKGERIKKVDCKLATLSLRKSTSVVVDPQLDIATLPAEFVRVIPETREPDKIELARALKNGAEFDGVSLVEKESLNIKCVK